MCPVDGTEPSGSFVFKNYSSGDTCRVDCTCVLNLIRIGYNLFLFVTGKTSFNILSTHLRKSSSKWKFRLPIVALKWDMPWSCTRIGLDPWAWLFCLSIDILEYEIYVCLLTGSMCVAKLWQEQCSDICFPSKQTHYQSLTIRWPSLCNATVITSNAMK